MKLFFWNIRGEKKYLLNRLDPSGDTSIVIRRITPQAAQFIRTIYKEGKIDWVDGEEEFPGSYTQPLIVLEMRFGINEMLAYFCIVRCDISDSDGKLPLLDNVLSKDGIETESLLNGSFDNAWSKLLWTGWTQEILEKILDFNPEWRDALKASGNEDAAEIFSLWSDANKFRDERAYSAVLYALQDVIDKDHLLTPRMKAEVNYRYGEALHWLGSPHVVYYLNLAVSAMPRFRRAWDLLGWIHYISENYAEALQCFEKSQSIDPSFWQITYYLGECLYWLDRYSEAIDILSKFAEEMKTQSLKDKYGLVCKPHPLPHPRPWVILGAAYLFQRDLNNVWRCIKEAKAIDSEYKDLLRLENSYQRVALGGSVEVELANTFSWEKFLLQNSR